MYIEWFSKQVSQQLEKGIQPADVKVSLGLIELKVMHAKWILELYNHLCHQNEIIVILLDEKLNFKQHIDYHFYSPSSNYHIQYVWPKWFDISNLPDIRSQPPQ